MTSLLHSFLRNILYSGRALLRQPGQTLVIVLTLAVGIGANTAIFGFVMEYFYWESGAPEPDRLFYVVTGTEESKNRSSSYPDALSYQESLGEIGELSIWVGYGAVVRLPGDQNGEGMAAYRVGRGVSSKTFELLGVRAAQGRLFSEEDMRPGAPPVAVLQNYFWRRYLGADPEIIGQTLEVNGMAFTVVGVVQRETFDFDLGSGSLFVPIHHLDDISGFDQLSDPVFRQFKTMFRLRDEVAREAAETRLDVLATTLDEERPWGGGEHRALELLGVEERVDSLDSGVVMLLAAVGLLLLLACANVANLLLARAAGRQREIAVMTAIGASHRTVAGRLLVESVLLSLAGAAVGLALARRLTVYMEEIIAVMPLGLGSWGEGRGVPGYDDRVLLFTLGLAVVTGCLFGLAPIAFAARTDVVSALKTGNGQPRSGRRIGARQLLVVAQVLLSTVLLLGAGLLVRSLQELQRRDQGFESEEVLLAVVATAPSDAEDPALDRRERLQLYDLARQRLAELPGVRSAALIFQPLAAGYVFQSVVEVPGRADDGVVTDKVRVSPGMFETYGIQLLSGRDFNDADREGGVGAVVVSRTFAELHWPGSEPLGHEIRVPEYADRVDGGRFVVVGVAEDVRHGSRREPLAPLVYLPLGQTLSGSRMTVVVRTHGAPESATEPVRAAVAAVHPDLALSEIGTYDHLTAVDLFEERLFGNIAALFGLFGLVIACLGIYSVMSCSVSYRVREIGIRMAVGANSRDVIWLVLGEALTMVGTGVLLGVALALGLGRFLASQLYGVSATDLRTFVFLPLLLAAVGVVAAWLPALRAAKLAPKVALLEQ